MQVGIHFANFTLPGGARGARADAGRDRARGRGGGRRRLHADGPLVPDGAASATAHDPMLEGYTDARASWPARPSAIDARAAGHRRDLPAPRAAGQDRHHPRRAVAAGGPMLGIGAAWYEREHLGARRARSRRSPSGSSGSRRRCRSACRCGATTTARTRASTTSWPRRSARRRRSSSRDPPILIGGSGERKTLRLVAQYADACNLFAAGPTRCAHKLEVLDRHCETEGRDPADDREDDPRRRRPGRRPRRVPHAAWRRTPRSASTWSRSHRGCPIRCAMVTEIGEKIVPRLAQLG